MSGESDEDDSRWRRRLLLLLVLLVLILAGGGIGTFVFGGGGGDATAPGGTPTAASPTPSTPTAGGNVSLTFLGDATFVDRGGVVPNQSGESRRVVRNDGSVEGHLAVVAVNVTDSENGIVDAEAGVDDSPNEGELSDHLLVRLSVVYPDGERVRVVGDESDDGDESPAFVPLSAVTASNETVGDGLGPGETATLVFEWRIAADAGNEVQSDTATFDLVFQLRQSRAE